MKIERQALHNNITSHEHVTSSDTPFEIGWTRHKDNDSHLGVSSQPLIKYETPNPTATPKFVYLCACSSTM